MEFELFITDKLSGHDVQYLQYGSIKGAEVDVHTKLIHMYPLEEYSYSGMSLTNGKMYKLQIKRSLY